MHAPGMDPFWGMHCWIYLCCALGGGRGATVMVSEGTSALGEGVRSSVKVGIAMGAAGAQVFVCGARARSMLKAMAMKPNFINLVE